MCALDLLLVLTTVVAAISCTVSLFWPFSRLSFTKDDHSVPFSSSENQMFGVSHLNIRTPGVCRAVHLNCGELLLSGPLGV